MHKSYAIDQSQLYKIIGLRQLETRLNIKVNRLQKLLHVRGYRTFNTKKGRLIQHPIGWLNTVHKKIANYLSSIILPDYVYSQKGRSYVGNAKEHKGVHPVIKTDISGYFQNITWQMIKKMFVDQFKCSNDVAKILADICSYQQKHLPTGSAISGYIAYFACKDLFDSVNEYAKKNSCTFTLYVDDLTISGNAATKRFLYEIKKLIRAHGLSTSAAKSLTYSAYAPKLVTGVVIRLNHCLLPNKRHKKINELKNAIQNSVDEYDKQKNIKSLQGHLNQVKQIEKANSDIPYTNPELIYS